MKDVAYKILWSTIEDYVGLWEILWELNSLFPENGQKENQVRAKQILKHFLEQNLVTFYMSTWGSDKLTELQFKEASKMLNGEKYWQAPQKNEQCIKIGNTEKGEKCYNDELLGDIV